MKAQRAYVVVGTEAERAIANSQGEVYTAELGWHVPAVSAQVVTLPGIFDRWVDVPQSWLGHSPWFPSNVSRGG